MTPNKLDELTVLTDARAATFDAYIIARIVKRLMDFLRAHPEQPLALIPASINDVHRLIQRGMIAEEVQLAVQEQLPGLQQEIANAFYDAADEIAKDYIADALMDTTEFVDKGIEEATGLTIEDIQREVHRERVEEGVESPDTVNRLEELVKEIERRQEERTKEDEDSVGRTPEPPQAPPTAPNRPENTTPEQTPNEPPKEPTKPTDGGDDYNYPDFVETCGYGNILGICGINCRHTFSAFRPGINIDRGTNVDYEKNAERYKLTQKQRAMEREIRKIERRLAALRASGDDSEETKAKIDELVSQRKKLGEQYAKFTRENNLASENWRFAISTATGTPALGPGVLARSALNPTELEKLDEMYRRTNGDVRNYCRTTAPATEQAFIDACDNAYIKARGGISLNNVILEAIDEVAKQGVTTVSYESGRSDRIEVAIARAVRTGINQANAAIILGKCAEQGINYVKVSEHMGARVTKKDDYTNHAWWQGKVYKLNWDNPALKAYSPKPVSETSERSSMAPTPKSSVVYLSGEIDTAKYSEITPNMISKRVVATKKQIAHILERHPEVGNSPERFMMDVINEPDYIFRDKKNANTAMVVKEIGEGPKSHLIILKLMTADGPEGYENSVITSWDISEKRLNNYLKNGDLVYSKSK